MHILRWVSRGRLRALPFLTAAAILGICLAGADDVRANHPVLVEGNCDSPVAGTTVVEKGTCGDFDGDGRIGTAEDTDGADRIFGTLNAALGPGTGAAAGTGINQNGMITIVGHGRFSEALTLTPPAGGGIQIVAAPGVFANIDAVFQGDPEGQNSVRQEGIGITIIGPADGRVLLRNLTIRNWAVGVRLLVDSRVTIDNCRFDSNRDFAIQTTGGSRLAVYESEFTGTGFRLGTANNTTTFGDAIVFQGSSGGKVFKTLITGSKGAAIRNTSSLGAAGVAYYEVTTSQSGAGTIVNATRETEP
jgi:hypothetical protein